MKNVYFMVAFAAFALLACTNASDGGDDPSSSSGISGGVEPSKPGACYVSDTGAADYAYCMEGITESVTVADCVDEDGDGSTYTFRNSCPSGEKYKCRIDLPEGSGYLYLYGEIVTVAGIDCSDAGGVSVTPSSSSASRPSSSSASNPTTSSNSNSGTEVCYVSNIPNTGDLAQCLEGINYTMTRAECQLGAAQNNGIASFPQVCSAEYKLKCIADYDGLQMYVYIYGEIVTLSGMTCEKIGFIDADSPSNPSSSATACYVIDDEDYGTTCLEDMTSSECADWAAGEWHMVDSCPSSGIVRRCDYYSTNDIYFYDSMWVNLTCDDL